MQCLHPILGGLPCGRCIACRVNQARDWSTRLIVEGKQHRENVFMTLTYDDDHIPPGRTLVKKDIQDFMKKLRKKVGDGVRFYAAGEYGTQTNRPHYHLVLFGLGLGDPFFGDLDYYRDELRGHLKQWPFGFVTVSRATSQRMKYVAKYVTKKITGDKSEAFYHGRTPEFALMSRRPGIGLSWFAENWDKVQKDRGVKKGKSVLPIPKAAKRKFSPRDFTFEYDMRVAYRDYPLLCLYDNFLNSLNRLNKVCANAHVQPYQASYEDFQRFLSSDHTHLIVVDRQMNEQEVKNFMANLKRKEML